MGKSFYTNVILFFCLLIEIIPTLFYNKKVFGNEINTGVEELKHKIIRERSINWEKIQSEDKTKPLIFWEKSNTTRENFFERALSQEKESLAISSLNRSIIFGNKIVGPDISWIVPNGFKWSERYKFDISVRGYNQDLNFRRSPEEKFLGWNNGDAVGLISYQFLAKENSSFGLNLGLRSITHGESGNSPIGDGTSLGFRSDYKLSNTSGFAFGAEQLINIDGITDTGRDLYVTFSKAFWKNNEEGEFPLRIATAALATGRLAEGNIKGLCSDLFDGAGTEAYNYRRLCWAPVFSLANVFNESSSAFFEYNSRFFLIGTSLAPFEKIPLRTTFAVTIADHTDNYKLYGFDDMTWTFRLSLGF